jgi:hypothetical protein
VLLALWLVPSSVVVIVFVAIPVGFLGLVAWKRHKEQK